MKKGYDKYMDEVIEMKEAAYRRFKESGYESYTKFIKDQLKDASINNRKDLESNSSVFRKLRALEAVIEMQIQGELDEKLTLSDEEIADEIRQVRKDRM